MLREEETQILNIPPGLLIPEAIELLLRESQEARRRRGISAPEMDPRRRELDEALQEDPVVARAVLPEQLPLLVGLEEATRPELLEPLREERRIGAGESPAAVSRREKASPLKLAREVVGVRHDETVDAEVPGRGDELGPVVGVERVLRGARRRGRGPPRSARLGLRGADLEGESAQGNEAGELGQDGEDAFPVKGVRVRDEDRRDVRREAAERGDARTERA